MNFEPLKNNQKIGNLKIFLRNVKYNYSFVI